VDTQPGTGERVYLGIDPTAGRRPFHFAALDADLKIVAQGEGDLEVVIRYVASLRPEAVAVDAPQSPNQGLMLRPKVRRRFDLSPDDTRWGQWKVCEYELRRRNIRLYNTPDRSEDAPAWMRHGFTIYDALAELGYVFFIQDQPSGPRTMLEVHPHACFTVLLGRRPFLKSTLEGRLQRQLVLFLQGLDIPNPMHALEEITRHHLLSGQLPLQGLLSHDELDALAAAFTAYLVGTKPALTCQVGDPGEGLITLPAPKLEAFYH
jgi:predicted nuclease with RNAse H fold